VWRKSVDDDHKKLIDMLNRLYEGMKNGQGKEVVGKVLHDLIRYTKFHFAAKKSSLPKPDILPWSTRESTRNL